jgi:hypothetical protein
MTDRLADVRALLPGVRLEPVDRLGGSHRSEVRRVLGTWPDGRRGTLIVKQFLEPDEGWTREVAALSMDVGEALVPQLVAAGGDSPVVVMADLGSGPSVADALLGTDADAAADAVLLWAGTLARLHRATLGRRDQFRAALRERTVEVPVADCSMFFTVDDAAGLLEQYCGELGVGLPSGAMAQLRELPRRLGPDGPAALTPSDACPDNNIRVDGGLALLDFEGAQWRHVAWDVAYLTVPWPSCWCSWRMPAELAERALERYRATVEDVLPYVRTHDFRDDVAAAAVGWTLLSTAWFLPRALRDDPPAENAENPAHLTPTRRAMILHRLDGARRHTELPALAKMAARLRADLAQRWGEVPLAYAPAFESD